MRADLHFGDNLEWLGRLKPESVDLCYIDPPFNSQAGYNIIVGGAQVEAFGDTWSWGAEDMRAYRNLVALSPCGAWAEGMMKVIGPCGMFSYLIFMAERLDAIRRVLKPTGSIYVHCDQSANYHIRLLMDAVFGAGNCRREIVWDISVLSGFKTIANNWIRGHDTILFYTSGDESTFNKQTTEHRPEYIARFNKVDADGRRYFDGRGKPRYLDDVLAKGKAIGDVWGDVMSFQQAPTSKERVGYPTQKPLALLDRIILASSNPGDLVMDCFLGSGTTAVSAVRNGRNFIGCDLTFMAVDIAMERLKEVEGVEVHLTGHPETLDDARTLAERDKFQFQAWALSCVGVSTDGYTAKKGKDSGIDGRLVEVLKDGSTYTTIISVKGGKPKLVDVRDVMGTAVKENAQRAVLLTLDEPTKDMITTAASGTMPVLVLTAQDLLDGKKIPPAEANA